MKAEPADPQHLVWYVFSTETAKYPTPPERPRDLPALTMPQTVGALVEKQVISPEVDVEALDWWFQCVLPAKIAGQNLCFSGLTGVADIYVNDELLLTTENAFRTYIAEIPAHAGSQSLTIRFRSFRSLLTVKRPRPRWKPALVRNQSIRWLRTPVLGWIRSWGPQVPHIGILRAISLGNHDTPYLRCCNRRFEVNPGNKSWLAQIGEHEERSIENGITAADDLALWYPHTHGHPTLHNFRLREDKSDGAVVAGKTGVRTVEWDEKNCQISVNGIKVFAQGVCWTPLNPLSLTSDEKQLAKLLKMLVASGVNMLRVGGTMCYEQDAFYHLCSELGIMVLQDFMFANMDYPVDDPAFRSNVEIEIEEQTLRLLQFPCVVMFCGNSEVEQQAAMLGRPEDEWRSTLFYDLIPSVLERLDVGLPYIASSPNMGVLPFYNDAGVSHYFGVGGYRRDLSDIAISRPKFSTECLAFSNVPESNRLKKDGFPVPPLTHTPDWKSGVPRDANTGWDFEDVRDFYVRELFGVDPLSLRLADTQRYFRVSQVVTGELMLRACWAMQRAGANGMLIWFLKDMQAGAGWGVLDHAGQAKPCLYQLARAWQTIAIGFVDEGMNGLGLICNNSTADTLEATLVVKCLQSPANRVVEEKIEVCLEAHSRQNLSIEKLLGRFVDVNYRYKFGPPSHDVVNAQLLVANQCVAEDTYFPLGLNLSVIQAEIKTTIEKADIGFTLEVESDCFLEFVCLELEGVQANDNYFHLMPGQRKTVALSVDSEAPAMPKGRISALNSRDSKRLNFKHPKHEL